MELKNKLEILLIGLKNHNLIDDREQILESIDLLRDSVSTSMKNIKTKQHQYLDDNDDSNLDELRKIEKMVSGIDELLVQIKEATPYSNLTQSDVVSVNVDTSESKPVSFVLKGKVNILSKNTWRNLFYETLMALESYDQSRFNELILKYKDENYSYCRISDNANDLMTEIYKNKPFLMPKTNVYIQLSGNADVMLRYVNQAIQFFGLQDHFKLNVEQLC